MLFKRYYIIALHSQSKTYQSATIGKSDPSFKILISQLSSQQSEQSVLD